MKSAVYFFLGLVLGAAGGAYVAKSIAERKAEDRIEKATLEAREYYKNKSESKKEEPPKENMTKEASHVEFSRIYGKAFDVRDEVAKPDPDVETYAYEISQEEFGEDAEYTTYSLDYYADGNLVDETGNIVDDPVHLVGGDVLDDISITNPVAYVRNDITKTDYEICFVDSDYEQDGAVKD